MLKRAIQEKIEEYLNGKNHKIFFIWGPRRSGKTTLIKALSKKLNVPWFNFDVLSDREKFIPEREVLQKIASEQPVILIDEIQNHPEATIALKILYDEFDVKIIATGSSELRQKAAEAFDTLAGRFEEHYCLPLSTFEIAENIKIPEHEKVNFIKDLAVKVQIFGSYPEVYTGENLSFSQKADLLQNLLDTYVLKDVVNIYDLKNEKLARDILTKIALQLGCEVSLREIAASLGANVSTVANYIEIFIKNYILISLPSFGINIRKSVSENRKLYFYDLGIRNILVKDFRELNLRPDKGGLFENFIISEIEKHRKNTQAKQSLFFYREYGGREVDLILEDYQKNYTAVEIKTQGKGGVKDIFPLPHKFRIINNSNYFQEIDKVIER